MTRTIQFSFLTLLLIFFAHSHAEERLSTESTDQSFLTPLQKPMNLNAIIVNQIPSDLRDRENSIDRLDKLSTTGGTNRGINGIITSEPQPNLQVKFLVEYMENVIISDGGADNSDNPLRINVLWQAHSTVATLEKRCPDGVCSPVGVPIPPAGELWSDFQYTIYDGLVLNGCGSTAIYPIEFESWVYEGSFNENQIVGEFSRTDNTTIQPNGYWNFSYTIRVADANSGVSDIKIKGRVQALCTNKEDYSD